MRNLSGPLVLVLCAASMLAQSAPPNGAAQNRPMGRGGEPCWQQAGIDKSVMEQVHEIARDAHSKIENVCSNTSLTPQQKQQQVREIREAAMQKREGLLTADQQKALTACQQQQHGGNHPGMGIGGGGPHEGMGGGGCGEMPNGGRRGAPNGGQGNGTGSGNPPPSQSPQNQSSPN